MISPQHQPLWNKIRTFALDDPNAAIPFSAKLAAGQQWSDELTRRAIEEYRKFILLCCISQSGASPSRIVDEVWHLHLTYTQSYWNDFCRDILGRDLHHHPSAGGDAEDHKHTDWYKETLELYRKTFDTNPPADIWPQQIPLPQIPEWRFSWTGLTFFIPAILAVPFLLVGFQFDVVSPFDLRGPDFLIFFPVFAIALILSYTCFRFQQKAQLDRILEEYFPSDISPFQMAGVLYGKHRALQTALVDLSARGLIEVQGDSRFLIRAGQYQPRSGETNPLIPALLREEDGSLCTYNSFLQNWYDNDQVSHPMLEKLARFANRVMAFRFWHILPQLVLILLLLARISQAISNHRPFVFLIYEALVLLILMTLVTALLSRRNLINSKLRKLYGRQIDNTRYDTQDLPRFAVDQNPSIEWLAQGALLMAVFDISQPRAFRNDSGSSWDSGASSCGSSSDGGGASSCGSSCGSSGCGGCGGGGGD